MSDDNSNDRNKRENALKSRIVGSQPTGLPTALSVPGVTGESLYGRSDADITDIERRLGGRVT